jgi:hypothetical protein
VVQEIEQHLRTYLLSFPAVTDVVGTRIRPNHAAQEGDAYPYVIYHRVSNHRWRSTGGDVGVAQPRIQFDCYGDTYAKASSARAAIAGVIAGFTTPTSSGSGGVCLLSLRVEDERDDYEEPVHGEEIGEHVCSLDVMVIYS